MLSPESESKPVMRNWNLYVLLAVAVVCKGAEAPVRLAPHLQKFRTFYSVNDPAVPAALRRPAAPLPLEAVTAIAVAGDGAVWYGTAQGLVRVDNQAGDPRDRNQYFAGLRYLPDDAVRQLAADGGHGMWVRTNSGVAHIELRQIALSAKAALFEERIRKRHDRHGLVAPANLRAAGDLATSQVRDDDNDGLWTAMYAAAECFRYAVTKSAEALANARKSTEAVLFLEEVAGKRGFPARSYIRPGEPMPAGGQWHWTPDGAFYWKGDTSSDEIVGHFFLYGIAADLLPDAALKKRIRETAARIMDHILDHGYYLMDLTGQPTRWGRWSPEYFRAAPEDSPLNSLEILSFLRVAFHLTGNPRYEAAYRKLAVEMGYAKLAARYRELRDEINYSDEELAMLSFYSLFRYQRSQDPPAGDYRRALEAWWENEARELSPLWSFIYAVARPDRKAGLDGAAWTLYRMPVDTIDWSVKNSLRADITFDAAAGRSGRRQSKTLLPRDELPVMKWNASPFEVDGGGGGGSEDDGTAFLLPYWMGRYHRLLLGE